jgi:hypothetical protein
MASVTGREAGKCQGVHGYPKKHDCLFLDFCEEVIE